MIYSWEFHETSVFYCKECNKIFKQCYELDNIFMCSSCFSEDLTALSETEARSFIRKKRLEKLNEVSK